MPARTVLAAVTTIFLATVGITSAARVFQWTTIPIASDVAETGRFNPAAIRGKMVFADVIAASGVPEAVVMERFTLTREDLHAPIKDAAMKYGFEIEDVRHFLAAYLAGDTKDAPDTTLAAPKSTSFDPQSITGTMTLEEVATASGIPLKRLIERLAIVPADSRVPLKELKTRYPFDTQAVRDAVGVMLNE
ncbi:MAG: hypothetical protein ACYDCO_21225 [Armatimonadota bacterium]